MLRADLARRQSQLPPASGIDSSRNRFDVPTRLTTFHSFGRRLSVTTYHQRPDRYRQLEASLGNIPRIARGAGLSYAAASFGPGIVVQEMTAFSRILAFDERTLQVEVEAGAGIGDVLAWAAARGLCIDVVPGYPAITVGGCIAADVHGKNALRVGTFRECTRSITLYRPDVSFVTVSREAGSDVFEATCGGFGLTGLIVCAVLQLVPLPARRLTIANREVESFEHAAHVLLESKATFAYSWHPGGAKAISRGAGLVFESEWDGATDAAQPVQPFSRTGQSERFEPMPIRLWNGATLAAAAAAFRLAKRLRIEQTIPVFDSWFPAQGHELYYRLFGASGFCEMQLLVPVEAIDRFCESFRRVLAAKKTAIAFLSLKAFRGGSQSLGLSGAGLLFAVDYLPSRECSEFESAMDALVLDTGSQPNVAKDSRIGRQVAERSLPGLKRFRETLAAIDPERRYQSALSQRLAL